MRDLTFSFGPGTLKHLGSLMYGGGLVKPVAELVANAWDADASKVEITLPTRGNPRTFEVTDNGHGMTWEECQHRYLTVGVDRRVDLGAMTRSGQRRAMGRKGIGKLGVISAAPKIEVETVALLEDRTYWHTKFQVPYADLLEDASIDPADAVVTLADGPAPAALTFLGSRTGTRTRLLEPIVHKLPNRDQFIRSMFSRFGQFADADAFVVTVNGKDIPTLESAAADQDFEFKFEGTENVEGVGAVTWWLGYTAEPQPDEELTGIGIYANKRMAVERPFFFNLTKGFTGQLSNQYMTGVVIVDALDEEDDLIASDRGNINWEHPVGAALQKWGQKLIRDNASKWDKARGKRKLKGLDPDARLMTMINKLPDQPRKECKTLLRRLAKIPHVTKTDIDRTARVLLNGLQHDEFRVALKEMNESRAEELPELLHKWSVMEALLFLPVVRSRVDVIRKLEQLIKDAAPEFPDIFVHLKENPELLRPEWQPLAWNNWMDTIAKEVFQADTGASDGQRRPDILCLSDSKHFVIVELKRPQYKVSEEEAKTFLHYIRRIKDEVEKNTHTRGGTVEGLLICDDMHADARHLIAERNDTATKTWAGVLEEAERLHGFILDRTLERVPGDDPRVAPYLDKPVKAVKRRASRSPAKRKPTAKKAAPTTKAVAKKAVQPKAPPANRSPGILKEPNDASPDGG